MTFIPLQFPPQAVGRLSMRWKLAVIMSLTLSVAVFAESPLSGLGYGTPRRFAGTRAAGMGYVSAAIRDSVGLNLLLPAAWDGSPRTRFALHGVYQRNTASDASGDVWSDDASLGGVGMTFPLGRDLCGGVAITPSTWMNYRWSAVQDSGWARLRSLESGRGSVAAGLIALSIPAGLDSRVGIGMCTAFGTLAHRWDADYPDVRADSLRRVGLESEDRLTGLGWTFSWQRLGEGINFGMAASGPVRARVERRRLITANNVVESDEKTVLDERYDLPASVMLGAGRQLDRHLLALEFRWEGWGQIGEPVSVADDYVDGYGMGLGWEWSPVYRPLDSAWRSLTYRTGFYTERLYTLSAAGHAPRRTGVTAGFSLPYNYNNSRLDLALELAWQGDETRDGAAERIFGLSIGFNHQEEWFVGRRGKY